MGKYGPILNRLISTVFSSLEAIAFQQVIDHGLLEPDRQFISSQKDIVFYLIKYLECLKIIKIKNGSIQLFYSRPHIAVDRFRSINKHLYINFEKEAFDGLIRLIEEYNRIKLLENKALFSRKKSIKDDKIFLRSCLSGEQGFILYENVSVRGMDECIRAIEQFRDYDKPVIIGGISLSKRNSGPKHALLLLILCMVKGYSLEIDNMSCILKIIREQHLPFRVIRGHYGYKYYLLVPLNA